MIAAFVLREQIMKKTYRIVIYIIAAIMILGGIMGLIKNNISMLANFDFRHILTGALFIDLVSYPLYIRIYGTVMAALEVLTVTVFIKFSKKTVTYILIVLLINAAVCLLMIVLGDLFAAVSLLTRLAAIVYIIYVLRKKL